MFRSDTSVRLLAPHSQNAQNSQLGAWQQLCEVTAPSAGLCCNQQAPQLPDDWCAWLVSLPCRCLLTRHQPRRCSPASEAGFKRPAVVKLQTRKKNSDKLFFSHFLGYFSTLISTTFWWIFSFIAKMSTSLSPQAFPSKITACRLILFIVHQRFLPHRWKELS